MTQQQYLQWMVFVCGDSVGASAADAELINWARARGMNPNGGWDPGAKLTKEIMAQTLVQLLKLPPDKGNSDAVRLLEREGIFIGTSGGYVTTATFRRVVNDGLASRAALSRCDDGKDKGHGHGGHDGDDDDDDDDDGHPPTKTKPGHGHGDKNHDHTGPPGKDKGKDK